MAFTVVRQNRQPYAVAQPCLLWALSSLTAAVFCFQRAVRITCKGELSMKTEDSQMTVFRVLTKKSKEPRYYFTSKHVNGPQNVRRAVQGAFVTSKKFKVS